MKTRFKFDPKKHAKKPKGKSDTVPGLEYNLGDLVRKFQAGGVVSNQLLREGEYHQHGSIPPEGHADFVDLTDAAKVAEDAHKAKIKINEEEIQKKKREAAAERQEAIDDAVAKALAEQKAKAKPEGE